MPTYDSTRRYQLKPDDDGDGQKRNPLDEYHNIETTEMREKFLGSLEAQAELNPEHVRRFEGDLDRKDIKLEPHRQEEVDAEHAEHAAQKAEKASERFREEEARRVDEAELEQDGEGHKTGNDFRDKEFTDNDVSRDKLDEIRQDEKNYLERGGPEATKSPQDFAAVSFYDNAHSERALAEPREEQRAQDLEAATQDYAQEAPPVNVDSVQLPERQKPAQEQEAQVERTLEHQRRR